MRICQPASNGIPRASTGRRGAGRIADFTGVSAPYEVPKHPDLVIPTGERDVRASLAIAVSYVQARFAL